MFFRVGLDSKNDISSLTKANTHEAPSASKTGPHTQKKKLRKGSAGGDGGPAASEGEDEEVDDGTEGAGGGAPPVAELD